MILTEENEKKQGSREGEEGMLWAGGSDLGKDGDMVTTQPVNIS